LIQDIYNYPQYLELESIRTNTEIKTLRIEHDKNEFIINLLQRENPNDLISPYGYAGYICNGDEKFEQESFVRLRKWAFQEGNITIFIRNKLTEVPLERSSECVFIDLSKEF
jgi:hypothetical protein